MKCASDKGTWVSIGRTKTVQSAVFRTTTCSSCEVGVLHTSGLVVLVVVRLRRPRHRDIVLDVKRSPDGLELGAVDD